MAAANPALVEFNRRNREFWANQRTLMDRRMADHAILETAVEVIESETKRHVAIRSQKSFEEALQDAERTKQRFIRQQARSGGKAARTDPLQGVIIDIVRQYPRISLGALLKELGHRQMDGVIEDVDETHIYFRRAGVFPRGQMGETIERKSTLMSAPISGLKHRLTRARKKVSKENRSR